MPSDEDSLRSFVAALVRGARGRPIDVDAAEMIRHLQLAEFRVRVAEFRARERAFQPEYRKIRLAAERRARKLLLSHLTPTQRDTVGLNGWFETRGSRGTLYRILTTKFLGNITAPHAGRKYCLCFADRLLPLSDHILGQKLLIESDEPKFLRVANATRI